MSHSARQVVSALADSVEAARLLEGVQRLTRHTPFNAVAARRRISDSIIKAGRYHL
jgi:hypothetical protein